MQFPRVHMNGTSAASLFAQYETALNAVTAAIEAHQKIECHGRDYYVISSEAASIAYREHRERFAKLEQVRQELEDLAVHVSASLPASTRVAPVGDIPETTSKTHTDGMTWDQKYDSDYWDEGRR